MDGIAGKMLLCIKNYRVDYLREILRNLVGHIGVGSILFVCRTRCMAACSAQNRLKTTTKQLKVEKASGIVQIPLS